MMVVSTVGWGYTPTNITWQIVQPWKSWQDPIAQAEKTDDHNQVEDPKLPGNCLSFLQIP